MDLSMGTKRHSVLTGSVNASEKEDIVDREEAIRHIEMLFPADSGYEKTAEIGRRLLDQAKRAVGGWRTESTAVLIRYADLCIREGNAQARR